CRPRARTPAVRVREWAQQLHTPHPRRRERRGSVSDRRHHVLRVGGRRAPGPAGRRCRCRSRPRSPVVFLTAPPPATGVKLAELVLFAANIVYATSYVATRATLGTIPPGTLAFARLVIAWTALAPFARPRAEEPPISRHDRRTIAWMGLLGFAAAYAFSHWGIARSP